MLLLGEIRSSLAEGTVWDFTGCVLGSLESGGVRHKRRKSKGVMNAHGRVRGNKKREVALEVIQQRRVGDVVDCPIQHQFHGWLVQLPTITRYVDRHAPPIYADGWHTLLGHAGQGGGEQGNAHDTAAVICCCIATRIIEAWRSISRCE